MLQEIQFTSKLRAISVFIFILLLPQKGVGQADNIDSILQTLGKSKINFKRLNSRFEPIYIEGASRDSLEYILKGTNMKYCKYDNGNAHADILVVGKQRFSLLYDREPLDLDIEGAHLYRFNFRESKYFCIMGGGTGLLRSGSYQQITFFVLIENTKKESVNLCTSISLFHSIYCFANVNNDKQLDFLFLTDDSKHHENYIIRPLTYSIGSFVPLNYNGKKQFATLSRDENGKFHIIDRQWIW